MRKIQTILILILLCIGSKAFTQNTEQSMIVGNSLDTINPYIKIKWFIPEIYPTKGVNIYKRGKGQSDWIKINQEPFKKGDYDFPNEAFLNDTTLDDYISFIDGLSRNEIKGLTKAMIFIKGIQNSDYARYIGIEYHDSNVKLGDVFQYKVAKITNVGEKEIGVSGLIKVRKHIPIAPPQELQIKAGDTQALIKWKPDKARFYGANIYRKTEKEQEFRKITSVPVIISKRRGKDGVLRYPEIFFTDDSLSNGVTYYYKVVALDYFGCNSKYSDIFKVIPKDKTAPLAPQFLRCKVDLLKVNLTWENRYNSDIQGLNIYRSLHHNREFQLVNQKLLDYEITEYTDEVKEPGKYYYYVASVDSSGNEGKSFMTLANVMDIYPPAQPKGLYAEADTGRIILRWLANNEKDLRGYQVYRTVDKDKKNRYVLLNASPFIETIYIDSLPLSAKNKFHYRVAALDSSYNRSEYSDFAAETMPDIVPPAQPFIKDITITEQNYMQIHWIPNADLDLKAYDIFRERITDSISRKEKLNQNPLSPTVKHFTDRWAEEGIKYNYYLQASDSSENLSEYSNPFPGIIPYKEENWSKDAVKYIDVKNKKSFNLIKWELDIQEEYLGLIVYRKKENEIYKPITALMRENKFKDKDILPETTYYYQVRIYHAKYGEGFSKEKKIFVPAISNKN